MVLIPTVGQHFLRSAIDYTADLHALPPFIKYYFVLTDRVKHSETRCEYLLSTVVYEGMWQCKQHCIGIMCVIHHEYNVYPSCVV
jgi:hypothetical protein